MYYSTDHTIHLQDGSLFNFQRRFKKHATTLNEIFSEVLDGRSKLGKRHPLTLILTILFAGLTSGNTTVKDCHIWAIHNRKWFKKYLDLPHGIPDQRTLSRAIQKVEVESLVKSYINWENILYGADKVFSSGIASFDGKTMRGVHGTKVIRHILSLFSHGTHQILGQVGVTKKENEIPAFHRLLKQSSKLLYGMLLVGDALHTQKTTVQQILEQKADYLLFAKGNQELLEQELQTFFGQLPFRSTTDQAVDYDNYRERDITTQITTSLDAQMTSYLTEEQGWQSVATIGKIVRTGMRKTAERKLVPLNETVYLISSRQLTAKQVAQITRNHWCIENNLHWQKDYLFLEDRQTLRSGNAPQVMTFLRSMCLSLFNLWQFASPSVAVSNFKNCTTLQHSFLRMAGVV